MIFSFLIKIRQLLFLSCLYISGLRRFIAFDSYIVLGTTPLCLLALPAPPPFYNFLDYRTHTLFQGNKYPPLKLIPSVN